MYIFYCSHISSLELYSFCFKQHHTQKNQLIIYLLKKALKHTISIYNKS